MVTGEIAGKKFLFINIYAPVHGAVRIQFFRKLLQLNLPTEVEIICGGDFNCVARNGLDRIGGSRKTELGIKELECFAAKHTLWDAGYYNLPRVNGNKERRKYAGECHTHFHTAASGRKGSSRLDRFYVSAASKTLVRGVSTEESLCRSDHRAVLLELHSPNGVIRVKRRPKLYPPPAFVQAATTSLIEQTITEMGVRIAEKPNQSSITEWESLKSGLRTKMTTLKQEARRRMTSGFRQRIQRIKGQLVKLDAEGQEEGNTRADLIDALMQIQETRRGLKRRVLVANHAWSAKASTRRFFRRVCTKFGDNTIPTLRPRRADCQRNVHDKANILADSWAEIFSGKAEMPDKMSAFIGKYSQDWQKVDLADLDDEITEAEVAAAIARCKTGKACGPDLFGNEWYTDHAKLLTPILTRLFNDCLDNGHTPSSFLEAYIFSIGKGGDASNPSNYRPIERGL
ncbi:unnamed protein product [Phytophthora fragariaefolia]|uniref:Unnamed protein product n=1 Tax=Phytophthora fragariaefolia TaxID=1490495 RepID=A0A9W6TUZ5_9STRA|nr:unnamed protein product [Phytophthora fragariaefolia]